MIFVSSWDDGHPLDARLADALRKWNLKATFYVPVRNREGRDVMRPESIRALDASGFEIASHTLDHVYLPTVDRTERIRQLKDGRTLLESILGHAVVGFCYPGGRFNASIRQDVIESGFDHARTVENLRLEPGFDAYRLPTTLQFFPHRQAVLWRNFVRGGNYVRRMGALRTLTSRGDWLSAAKLLVSRAAVTGAVFHLWGHSWEVEQLGLWAELDGLLAHVASFGPRCMTVSELAASMKAGAVRGMSA